jgi:hypothetical protein
MAVTILQHHSAAYYNRERSIAMRIETELHRYRETLVHYREKAKQTIAGTEAGTEERREAAKLFFQCDGAIQALGWALELEDTDFNLPPIIEQREMGN